MKHHHHQLKTKPSTESLNFKLIYPSGSCLLSASNFPTFRTFNQRALATRFLFTIVYLLSGMAIVCGMCPESCTCDDLYQSVTCTNLLRIPKNIPNKTRFMSVTNGSISVLKRSDFFSLTSLRMLSLENNIIHTIQSGCFNQTKKILKLNLNGNRLKSFPEAVISLKRLTDLHLRGNNIVDLTTDKSLVMQKLKFIDLESNRLTKVKKKFFDSMSKLNTLKMSFNNIIEIDADWLSPLKNLEELEMENSFQTAPSIKEWFSEEPLTSLTSLNLAYNYITDLPSRTFYYFPNLVFLILNNNNISEFPSNVSCKSLEYLDLGYNRVEDISKETVLPCNNLTHLLLQENQIEHLPNTIFKYLHGLKYLNLNSNRLSSISLEMFASMTDLRELLLSGNMLQILHPRSLYQNPNLEVINLSHNQIEYLNEDFFLINKLLIELYLSNNYLEELPNIRNFVNLRFLDVSKNGLTSLPMDAFDGTSLEVIVINDNNLAAIYPETVNPLLEKGTLKRLIMDGNPIHCDCNIEWAYNLRSTPIYVSNFTCNSPVLFEDKGFLQIETYLLYIYLPICNDEVDTGSILTITIIWFSVMVFIVIVYWLKVYHKSMKLWRAWSPSKRKRKCEVSNDRKSNTFYRISNDNFWNNNHIFTNRMTSSFRRVRLTESLHSNEYLETIV